MSPKANDQALLNKQRSPSPHKLSNDTLIVSPITDANSENRDQNPKTPSLAKANYEAKEESPMDNRTTDKAKPTKSKLNPTCMPWSSRSAVDDQKTMEENSKSNHQNAENKASSDPNLTNLYKVNPAIKDRNMKDAMANNAPRNMPRLPINQSDKKGAVDVELQNKQLLAAGLDPNEFGSHDDVGFDEDEAQNGKQDRQNLYKTELCREWSTSGWCYYNKRCSFAHGLQELRPVFRSKKWRTKRCRNWHTTGYCPYEHRFDSPLICDFAMKTNIFFVCMTVASFCMTKVHRAEYQITRLQMLEHWWQHNKECNRFIFIIKLIVIEMKRQRMKIIMWTISDISSLCLAHQEIMKCMNWIVRLDRD